MGIVRAVPHRRRISLDARAQVDYGVNMETKHYFVIVVVALVAYVLGARYPAFAQKFGAA